MDYSILPKLGVLLVAIFLMVRFVRRELQIQWFKEQVRTLRDGVYSYNGKLVKVQQIVEGCRISTHDGVWWVCIDHRTRRNWKGDFFDTGEVQPIQKTISVLEYVDDLDFIDLSTLCKITKGVPNHILNKIGTGYLDRSTWRKLQEDGSMYYKLLKLYLNPPHYAVPQRHVRGSTVYMKPEVYFSAHEDILPYTFVRYIKGEGCEKCIIRDNRGVEFESLTPELYISEKKLATVMRKIQRQQGKLLNFNQTN